MSEKQLPQNISGDKLRQWVKDNPDWNKGWDNVIKGIQEGVNKKQKCLHPEHEPPIHLYLPNGTQYTHKCPKCGNTIILKSPDITY